MGVQQNASEAIALVDEALQRCVDGQLPVILVSLSSGLSEEATVLSFDHRIMTVSTPVSAVDGHFKRSAPVCLTLRLGTDAIAMLTTVQRISPPNIRREHPQLLLDAPSNINVMACSVFIRHEVASSSTLRARLRILEGDRETEELRVAELGQRSTTLALPPGAPQLLVGQKLRVALTHRGRRLEVGGSVERRAKSKWLIKFDEAEDNRLVDAQLQRLVTRIERERLRSAA